MLYADLARLYDRIYHWKPYGEEAARVRAILSAEGVGDGARLLDAACGTGAHLAHLRAWYDASGFDRSEAMITIARRRLTGVGLFVTDMATLEVDEPYDAITCLFSSIGYLQNAAALADAARAFAAALRPGGVLLVEPWLDPESFIPGHPFMDTYADDDLKLARASVSQRDGDRSIVNFHWLVAERGEDDVEHVVDRHEMWLCPREDMLGIFADAGFACRWEEDGLMKNRELLVAVRGG